MVQATLRSLADLVDILGGETVIGPSRSYIFADSTPRGGSKVSDDVEKDHQSQSDKKLAVAPPAASPTALSSLPSLPSLEETRRERAAKMREKRERQKQKKLAASTKLGMCSTDDVFVVDDVYIL